MIRGGAGTLVSGGLALTLGLLALWAAQGLTAPLTDAILACLIAGSLLGLTFLNALELLGGSSQRASGTYVLAQEVIGGAFGFLVGWLLLVGSLVLTALLSRLASAHLLSLFSPMVSRDERIVALLLLALLVLARLTLQPSRLRLLWPFPVLLLLAVDVGVGRRLGQAQGLAGEMSLRQLAIWLVLAYAPLEAVISARTWGPRPQHLLPAAVVAVLVALLLSFCIAMPVLLQAGSDSPAISLVAAIVEGTRLNRAWGLAGVGLGLLIAADVSLRLSLGTLRGLSQFGALPRVLEETPEKLKAPPRLLLLAFAGVGLLELFAPQSLLAELMQVSWLLVVLAVNITAIYSRQVEPERRRPFQVPFYPLVPALALGIGLTLLAALAPSAGPIAVALLLLGEVLYLSYCRAHQAQALIGTSVFVGEEIPPKPEDGFRVLVPVPVVSSEERGRVLPVAVALAEARGGDVILLRVIPAADPQATEERRPLAAEEEQLFRWAVAGEDSPVRVYPVTRLGRDPTAGILATAMDMGCDLIVLSWRVREAGAPLGRVLDPVVRRAPCDVVIVTHKPEVNFPERHELRRILVPVGGGPNAALAARLAAQLVHGDGGVVTLMHLVHPRATLEERAEGQARVEEAAEELEHLGLESVGIGTQVIEAQSVAAGLAAAGVEHDLVLMGASEQSLLDQFLFGNLPERVARLCPRPVVIVRRFQSLPRFWLRRVWDTLYGAVPTLNLQARAEVYRQIRRGARPNVDFFVMIGLAAIIATFGLLQSNAAVIIGAMLVAPLFTPILALTLGIAQGDGRLLWIAADSLLRGVGLATGCAFLMGMVMPAQTITEEMLARTQPSMLDLGIALASGAAGAYAVARKDVSAALPGVAIAAALVPPLATAGLGLAWAEGAIVGGAMLLFVTNLTAIVLAGAILFLLLGFRPAPRRELQARLRRGLVMVSLSLFLISIPLAWVSVRSLMAARVRRRVEAVLLEQFEREAGLELALLTVEEDDHGLRVMATVRMAGQISQEYASILQQALVADLRRPVRLRLVVWPIIEVPGHE